MTEDRIRLQGLTATGYHGVFDFEKRAGQPFSVDAVMSIDLHKAGHSDILEDTVSYADIANIIEADITGEPFDLIEALGETIAQHVLQHDQRIQSVEITVHKPKAPIEAEFHNVSVTVLRYQNQAPHRDPDLAAATPVRSVLALGSNLSLEGVGGPEEVLDSAIEEIRQTPGIDVVAISPRAATTPVGGPTGQPDYVNQVLEIATRLSPHQLLDATQKVEATHHRERKERWGARTLDVDIITYAGATVRSDRLSIPHPRAHERGFVLAPWAWMDPAALLNGTPVTELAEQVHAKSKDAGGGEDIDRVHRL